MYKSLGTVYPSLFLIAFDFLNFKIIKVTQIVNTDIDRSLSGFKPSIWILNSR